MTRQKKTEGETEVTLERDDVTVDVTVKPSDDSNGSKKPARKRSAGTRKRVPARKKTPPVADVQPVRTEIERAEEVVREVATQARELPVEVAQVRDELRDVLQEARQRAEDALQQIEEARLEVEQARKQYRTTEDQARQAGLEAHQTLDEVRGLRRSVEEAGRQLAQALEQAGETQESLTETRRMVEELRQMRRSAGETGKGLEKARQRLAEVEAVSGEARRSAEEARRAAQQAQQAWEELQHIRSAAEEAQQALAAAQEARARTQQVSEGTRAEGERLLEEVRSRLEEVRHRPTPAQEDRQEPPPIPTAPAPPREPLYEVSVRRTEGPRDRLVRHLQNVHAIQGEVSDALQDFIDETIDPDLRTVLAEHRRLTQRHKDEVEGRLRALDAEPNGGRGILQRLMGWVWESWRREPDDLDRALQNLLRASGAQQFEASLNETLAALAETIGDTTTAEQARRHAQEKRDAARALDPLVPGLARMAMQLSAAARAVELAEVKAELAEAGQLGPVVAAPVEPKEQS